MFTFDESDEFFVSPRTQVIGNMGESVIVNDLIRRRFYVYVPVIHRSPCDMIILKGTQTLRVEVKTSINGRNYPIKKHERYDVLVQVTLKNQRVRYKPSPESMILNFDAQIERCWWCGEEQPKTTDLSTVPCPCSGSQAAMREYYERIQHTRGEEAS
jgi:hypothetical protein